MACKSSAEYRTQQASRKAGWISHEDAAAMNAMVATADPIFFALGNGRMTNLA